MAAIGIIGVLTFLVYLVSWRTRPAQGPAGEHAEAATPTTQWYGFLLGAIVLALAVLLLAWRWVPDLGSAGGWQADPRTYAFIIVMLVLGGGGLLVFVVHVLWKAARRETEALAAERGAGRVPTTMPTATATTAAPPEARHQVPSATRLLGVLLLALALIVLNWSWVPAAIQMTMMSTVIYPVALATSLVMLFDKASRNWSAKGPGENFREWLFCDLLVFLLVLGWLNLVMSGLGDAYRGMFWDFLHVIVFFLVFWLIDRKLTRYRFLAAYAYLIGLPLLLLIWRSIQEIPVPEDLSWWSTIWPLFFLAIVFFVLEIIVLIVTRESNAQGAATAKDLLFLVLYMFFLIAAMPEGSA